MQDLPDNELDKLFRKSAEEFESPFSPQAWTAMRKKLDDEDDEIRGIAWWKTGVAILFLMILGVGSYYSLSNKPVHNPKVSSIETPLGDIKKRELKVTDKNISSTIIPKTGTKKIPTTVHKRSQKFENQPIIRSKKETSSTNDKNINRLLTQSFIQPKDKSNKKSRFGEGSERFPKSYNSPVKKKNNVASNKPKEWSFSVPEEIALATSNETHKGNTLIQLQPLTIRGWKPFPLALHPLIVQYDSPRPSLFVPKKQDPSSLFRKGLGIRALVAPDLSYITMNEMMKQPTVAVGLLLDYRFSKRWSVQTGAIKTIKLYHATGEQYQWPTSWNSQAARPTDISAECKVLDIPLNLRYDISQGVKNRWFANTGVSSYMMLNEKYTYTYPPHTYNIKKTWEGTTGNYWLSVLNLSFGFERQIGHNWSLQAEPYLKVPLAQVGMGKVMLNTSGIYISARYRLGRF